MLKGGCTAEKRVLQDGKPHCKQKKVREGGPLKKTDLLEKTLKANLGV